MPGHDDDPPCCRYAGQINTTDFFTRLLCGILYTGIAPRTFYTAPYGEEHFDGMPIDFVSGVIAATASAERGGFGTYHVVNPHWHDGVSLDRIVDWVQSAGYKVGVKAAAIHCDMYCGCEGVDAYNHLRLLGSCKGSAVHALHMHMRPAPSRCFMAHPSGEQHQSSTANVQLINTKG